MSVSITDMEKDPSKNKNTSSDDDNKKPLKSSSKEKGSTKAESQKPQPESKQRASEKRSAFFKPPKAKDKLDIPLRQESKSDDKEKQLVDSESSRETESNEHLTDAEVSEATAAIIESRESDIAEELTQTEPDSPEEHAAIANAAFLESLRERIESEDVLTPDDLDEAYEETVEDLEFDTEVTDQDSDTVDEEITEDNTDEIDDNVNDSQQQLPLPTQTPVSPRSLPPPVPPTPPSPSNPPTPPVPPIPPGPAPPQPPNQNPINPSTSQHALHSPNIAPTSTPVIVERRRGSNALVWAVVGYIVGRRGGRKRTEKKLQPKIEKLEKEVKELDTRIYEKEEKIRELAKKQVETKPKSSVEATKSLKKRREVRSEIKAEFKRKEELAANPTVEKVGKFSLPAMEVFRERRLPDGTEDSPKRKPVETMTVVELLEKVADVEVDNELVVKLYEQGRIKPEVLRQITKEYLRRGPYERTLRRELAPDPNVLDEKRHTIESARERSVDSRQRSNTLASNEPSKNENNTAFSDSQATPTRNITQSNSPLKKDNSIKNQIALPIGALVGGVLAIFIILWLTGTIS